MQALMGQLLKGGSGGGGKGLRIRLAALQRGIDDHVDEGQNFHNRDAQQGAGGAFSHAALHAQGRQGQGNRHLADLLDELGDCGGDHILMALDITAEGGQEADDENAGGNDPETQGSLLHTDQGDQQVIGEEHHQGEGEADDEQNLQGDAEDPGRVLRLFLCQVMGHHAGNRHRKTGAGQGQEEVVGREDRLEQAETLVPENTGQGDGKQDAHDLADDA